MLAQADRLLHRRAEAEEPGAVPARQALVIDERLPDARRDAGSQAVLSHIRALQHLGFAVSLVAADGLDGAAEASAALAAAGVTVHAAPFCRSVEEVLRRHAGRYELVYLHRSGTAARYLGLVRCYQARAHVIYSVADLHHAPNLDAVLWLVQEVMPLVWRHDPAITCTLAGSAMPDCVRRLAGPGLAVAGQMADLGTVFDRVRLTVAPLRFGAGLKGKVIESFAAGLPCAMTPIAAEGMALPPMLRSLVGRDATEVAAAIVRLHDDPAESRRIATAGRRLVRRSYGPDAVLAGLQAALSGGESAADRPAGATA